MARQYVSFREYVSEVLKQPGMKPGKTLTAWWLLRNPCPGCMTQGRSLEEARELLSD